jgi:hypothetical protein
LFVRVSGPRTGFDLKQAPKTGGRKQVAGDMASQEARLTRKHIVKRRFPVTAAVTFLRLLLLAVAIGAASTAWAADPAPAAQPPQAANPSINPVTQGAVNAGVLACAGRINDIMNFLGAGSQEMRARIFPPAVDPDRRMTAISLEIRAQNTPTVYVGAAFAPNQANGCGATYEAVAYWSMTCDNVATKQFALLRQSGALGKEITVLDGGPALAVFLMPAGAGCISIKREVVQ